jgi:hypothetical protein
MTIKIVAVVGQWYAHRDKGELFQVVAIDEDQSMIEMQDFDGSIDEIDFDGWSQMALRSAEAPEDWTGSVDLQNPDDLGYEAPIEIRARDWRTPVDELASELQDSSEADDTNDQ